MAQLFARGADLDIKARTELASLVGAKVCPTCPSQKTQQLLMALEATAATLLSLQTIGFSIGIFDTPLMLSFIINQYSRNCLCDAWGVCAARGGEAGVDALSAGHPQALCAAGLRAARQHHPQPPHPGRLAGHPGAHPLSHAAVNACM